MLRTPVTLLGALALAATLPGVARTETAANAKPLVLAQGPPLTEQEKARKEKEKKGPSPRQGPPPGPPAKSLTPPSSAVPPAGRSVVTPPPPKVPRAQPLPSGPPPAVRSTQPPPPKASSGQPFEAKKEPDVKKAPLKQVIPRQPPPPPPGTGAPLPKGPVQGVAPKLPKGPDTVAPSPGPSGVPAFKKAPQGPTTAVPRFIDVQKGRKEHVEGGRRVIEEPGKRIIVKQDNRAVIRHDEAARFLRHRDAKSERRPDGIVATFYARPDGTRVFTEVDRHGRLVRRYRRGHDGREHHIIDNRRFLRNAGIAVGVGAAVGLAILALAPPRVTIAREKYIVDYDRASEDDLEEALSAPPIERLERAYSLDEIRDNYELRQRMRHIEIGNIIFGSGQWEVTPDQYPKLERLARAILRVLRRNPDEVVMIEGYTDAVGSDVDNLSLSDRRAEAVAEILTQEFGVPPENLITQGYGEQFLKVDTQGPEPLNRRVDARRITPLMSER
jgi:outer membrane protein OmpA-like peptidoglycan-associated protein